MSQFTIYHNPNCSKSRATLALLEENDITPEIVYYLDNPPDSKTLESLLQNLGLSVRELIRKSEPEYEQLGLDDTTLADEIVFDLLCKHPILLQRPIVVLGNRAIIGRPPESVLQLIES